MDMKYVCVLSSNNFLDGVLLLNENLKALKSKYNLLCLINETITQESINFLDYFNIEHKLINKIDYKSVADDFVWKNTFDKLNIFSLTEYKKIVYLDSDMLILENLDHLFNENHLTMADNTPFKESCKNSCLMVIEPNIEDYKGLLNTMKKFDSRHTINVGDQNIINDYYGDKMHTLDESYNVMRSVTRHKRLYYDELTNNYVYKHMVTLCKRYTDKPKVIHYIYRPKPFLINIPFEDEYYNLYKRYLDDVRIKKNKYLIDNTKILVIVVLLNQNKNFNNLINKLNKIHNNIDIKVLSQSYLDSYILSNNINKNQIIHHKRDLLNIIDNYKYVSLLNSDMMIIDRLYDLCLNKCINYNLDICQYTGDQTNFGSSYLYYEKSEIINNSLITDTLFDKVLSSKLFMKYENIDTMIKHSKRVGIIGNTCYKINK